MNMDDRSADVDKDSKSARIVDYVGPGSLELRTIPLPMPGPDDMLLNVSLCGVDGSEIHMFRGEIGWVNDLAPMTFGDEILGTVADIGPNAAAQRGLKVGDRVVLEAKWRCGECPPCRAGQYYLCDTYGLISGYGATSSAEPPHLWGGYASHVFVPKEALVYPVPAELDDRTALVGCSPLANGIRWVTEAGLKRGDHVAIIGPGPQGLCCALVAMAQGATVTIFGLPSDDSRLEMARSLGVARAIAIQSDDSPKDIAQQVIGESGPAQMVIDLAGVPSAKHLGLHLLAKMGTFVNVALSTPASQPVDWIDLLAREIRIVSFASHPNYVQAGLEMALDLKHRGIDIGEWITHVYALEDVDTALAAAAHELETHPIKVALDPRLPGAAT